MIPTLCEVLNFARIALSYSSKVADFAERDFNQLFLWFLRVQSTLRSCWVVPTTRILSYCNTLFYFK
jgi:hypothetical protein